MAENGGIKVLSYFTQKLKSFFLSKDILSFLLFLALSSAFWFIHALGKEKETTISIPIRFVGLPLNVVVTNSPPEKIRINIKDQGLKLLDYSRSELTPLTIDLSRTFYKKGEILITTEQLSGKIKKYLKMYPSTTILDVHPDSILIQYQKLGLKKLPIRLVSNIQLMHQYMLSDKIKLEPEYVTVSGPKEVLDTLKAINTELVEYKELKDTVHAVCQLKPVKLLRYSVRKVKLSINVEPFTERKVEIPVISINCPPNLSVRTFPAVVTATYTVGLSHFNSLYPNDIQVYLDYNELKIHNLSKQNLKIRNNTSYISNIRISPQEVEFILEQK
jgi:Uncharacterized protein conserved in bacteria